jgi:DMSO/TMAO reductase YedYZ molybdopterin-dependent catalytic subunit
MTSKRLLVTITSIIILLADCTGAGRSLGLTPTVTIPATGTPSPTLTLFPSETPVLETATPQETPTSATTEMAVSCIPAPVIVPTAAPYPGSNQLDESTNLHVTGHDVPIDLVNYRLRVTGKVKSPLSISYDALRCMPKVTKTLDLICPGFFEDKATWAGVPLKYVLNLAGVESEAKSIILVAADGYERWVDMQIAMNDANFLAYEWQGEPLPILHGFPLRAVFPSMYGNLWVKWLLEIRVE